MWHRGRWLSHSPGRSSATGDNYVPGGMCQGSKDNIPPQRPGIPGVLTARCPTAPHVLTAWIPASSSLCVPTHPLCLPYPYPLMSPASPCPHSILTAWCFLHTPCSLCPQAVALVPRMPLCPPPFIPYYPAVCHHPSTCMLSHQAWP